MTKKVPKDGDVFIERGHQVLSRLIRWFTKSDYNHAGLIFIMTPERRDLLTTYGLKIPESQLGQLCVVEASLKVQVRLLKERLEEESEITLARCLRLTRSNRESVVRTALGFVGQRYGVLRLLRYGWDILTNTKGVRKMALDMMVCSYLVAFAYAVVGISFGVTPRECTPEDIARTIREDKDWTQYFTEWRSYEALMRAFGGPRPDSGGTAGLGQG